MIQITPGLAIDEKDIQLDFIRASGPGGQNVNKVATAVQLRFDVNNASLPDDVRQRLVQLAGQRITEDGTLLIVARRFRQQDQNRRDAMNRLVELIGRAAEKPTPRRKTKPSLAAKQRRLAAKRQRSETKRRRHSPTGFEE